jgi:predicted flap endonuclease-1-like 5' DNA nuclease
VPGSSTPPPQSPAGVTRSQPSIPTPTPVRAELESERDHARRVLASKMVELKSLESERERLRARVIERDQKIRELERRLEEARAGDARLMAAEDRARALEAEVASQRTRIAQLESELADALAWSPPAEDDLTKIKGIGPKYAAALKEIGIRRFAEIAAWSDNDVLRVADKLRAPPSRIRNAGWIEAARALSGSLR